MNTPTVMAPPNGMTVPLDIPQPPKQSLVVLFGWGIALALLAWAWQGADMRPLALVRDASNMGAYAAGFFPPDFTEWRGYLKEMIVTLHIALWGTALAIVCAIPCGLLCSSNIAPWWIHQPMRRLMDAARAINEMVFAMLFVVAVGLGPFAGVLAIFVHTTGILAKLFSEAVEAIEEAWHAIAPPYQPLFAWLEGQQAAQAQVQQYVQSLDDAAKGVEDEGFTLRFQTYISRNSSHSRSFAGLYAGFKATQLSPWLAGVNIVGPENGEVAMRDYVLHMRMIQFLKARWPATRLSLHAGELAVGMVPPEGLRHHIRDAVEIAGAKIRAADHGLPAIPQNVDGIWCLDPDRIIAPGRYNLR